MAVSRAARRLSLLTALVAASLAPALASAQATGTPEDAARLFKEGIQAQSKGDSKVACAKFRGSLAFALMPNTLFKVAQCEEQEGLLVAALRRWQQGIGLLPEGDNRLDVAKERAAALERRVPKVALKLSKDAPPKTRVLVDGTAIEQLEAPVLLDTGERTIVVEAPGRTPERLTIVLAEGDQKEIELPLGLPEAGSGPIKDVVAPPPPPSGNVRRTLGFVAGGLGVAGFVTAAVTGGMLLARDATIRENCPQGKCNSDGWDAAQSTGPLFTANTVGWIVGIAGVGAGVTLLLTSGGGGSDAPKAAIAPAILPGGGGAAVVVGRF